MKLIFESFFQFNVHQMAILTFTTDFGSQDYYTGVIKGAIIKQSPNLNIIDITNDIEPFNIVNGAFIVKNVYKDFPENTIHLVAVNNFYSNDDNRFIAVLYDNHYFIAPDNGILSLVFENDQPYECYELEYIAYSNFPLKEVFSRTVWHLTSGRPFHEIGDPLETITQKIYLQPVISPNQIKGSVIYIDHFENVVINITKELFDKVGHGRKFHIYFKRNDAITKISHHYYDVEVGETICLFNSSGYLELAINMGKAASMLGLKIEDIIQIDFTVV